jgi:hypothetical protein
MSVPAGYPVPMDAAARTRGYHEARPGRRAVVAASLADLRGPAHGTVTLPLRLFWSPPGRVWNLDNPGSAQAMYEHVLGQAIREEELATWLNGEMLAGMWPRLYLPKGVRRAWEERHPSLRGAAVA